MKLFDFHHHSLGNTGIYNLEYYEEPPDHPFSVGLHPMKLTSSFQDDFQWVKEIAKHPFCWAIGECGLDSRTNSPYEKEVFQMHIALANSISKPVIIHCVRKHHELLSYNKKAQTPWIIHGFNRKPSIADPLISKGIRLSFGKPLLSNLSLQTLFRDLSYDQFFLETDSHDVDIEEIYEKAAEIKGVSTEQIKEQVTINLEAILKNG